MSTDLHETMPELDTFRVFCLAWRLCILVTDEGAAAPPWMVDAIFEQHHAEHLRPSLLRGMEELRQWQRDDAAERALGAAIRAGLPVWEEGGIVALALSELAIRRARGSS